MILVHLNFTIYCSYRGQQTILVPLLTLKYLCTSQDFIKDDTITVKTSTPQDSSPSSNLAVVKKGIEDLEQKTGDDLTPVRHSSEDGNKSNPKDDTATKTIVLEPIDLSPLVDELISSSPFDVGEKEFENLDPSDLVQNSTADDGNTCSNSNNVADVFVGVLPVVDVALNVPGDVVSDRKEKERIIKQSSPFEKQMQDPAVSVVEKVMANQHESNVNLTTNKNEEQVKLKKCIVTSTEMLSSDVGKPAESDSKGINISNQVVEEPSLGSCTNSEPNFASKDNQKSSTVDADKTVETPDPQKLLKNSKQEETRMNDENVIRTSEVENNDVASVHEASAFNSRKKETAFSESCRIVSSLNENIKTTEDKNTPTIAGTSFGNNFNNPEDKVDTTGDRNEINKSNTQAKTGLTEPLDKDSISTQVEESCQTMETREIKLTQEQSNKDDENPENIDEQLSGSELCSFEGNLVRTSNRKRKAPPPRDLSVHPPGWVRSALQ